jgi:hypothetical protein
MPALVPGLLPPNERRRTTRVIRLALRVAEEALENADQDAAQVRVVLTSSAGDGEIIHKICSALLLPDRPVSPTDFHNSVHNAPGGYWSIATGCRQPSVSLSAHQHSFSAGLLEAATQVWVEQAPTLLVAYDHPPPFPLSEACPIEVPFATALVLMPAQTLCSQYRLELALTGDGGESRLADGRLEALRVTNPAARSLALLQALARRQPRQVMLPYLSGRRLGVSCYPLESQQ